MLENFITAIMVMGLCCHDFGLTAGSTLALVYGLICHEVYVD